MEDYKPNSHKFRAEQKEASSEKKQIQRVTTGNVTIKKKNTAGSTLKDIFISEDAANVKSYILMDVLIPAVKKAISDIVTNGIDMVLYGGNGSGRRKSSGDRVSYTRFSDPRDRRAPEPRTRGGYMHDDITFDNRGDAERVLMQLEEIIDRYGMASVADLNESAGVTGSYTDNKYGWTSLRTAEVMRGRDGYYIKLPKAMPFD